MGFVEFIQEYRWGVLVICLPLIVIYGRVLVLAALGGGGAPTDKMPAAPVRRVPPKPQPGSVVKPPGLTPPPEGRQEVLPGSLDVGAAGHQKAGAAKTVKLPVTPPKPTDSPLTAKKSTTGGDTAINNEAEALDSLFEKRADPATTVESATAALRRKASRMEELGFHHGIAPATVEVKGEKPAPPVSTTSPTEPMPAVSPVTTSSTPAAILPGGTAPRSSTAELTSILERIDKFLAEDTPSKAASTLPPAKTESTAMVKPISDEAAKSAPTPPARSAEKSTEAMPKVEASPAKPDPHKKTQPMWARPDAQDEDVDTAKRDEKKPDNGQQRLF